MSEANNGAGVTHSAGWGRDGHARVARWSGEAARVAGDAKVRHARADGNDEAAVGMCGVIRVICVIRLIRDSDTVGGGWLSPLPSCLLRFFPSKHIRFFHTQKSLGSNDQVIQNLDPHDLAGLHHAAREFDIFSAWGHVAAGVVVCQNHTGSG